VNPFRTNTPPDPAPSLGLPFRPGWYPRLPGPPSLGWVLWAASLLAVELVCLLGPHNWTTVKLAVALRLHSIFWFFYALIASNHPSRAEARRKELERYSPEELMTMLRGGKPPIR
jgi:hypothetical protein